MKFSWVYQVSQSKYYGKSVKGFLSYDQTHKLRNRDYFDTVKTVKTRKKMAKYFKIPNRNCYNG